MSSVVHALRGAKLELILLILSIIPLSLSLSHFFAAVFLSQLPYHHHDFPMAEYPGRSAPQYSGHSSPKLSRRSCGKADRSQETAVSQRESSIEPKVFMYMPSFEEALHGYIRLIHSNPSYHPETKESAWATYHDILSARKGSEPHEARRSGDLKAEFDSDFWTASVVEKIKGLCGHIKRTERGRDVETKEQVEATRSILKGLIAPCYAG